jgi:hypothetical protein
LQRVPREAWQIDVFQPVRRVERPQHAANSRGVRYTQPARIASLEIPLEHPAAERATGTLAGKFLPVAADLSRI